MNDAQRAKLIHEVNTQLRVTTDTAVDIDLGNGVKVGVVFGFATINLSQISFSMILIPPKDWDLSPLGIHSIYFDDRKHERQTRFEKQSDDRWVAITTFSKSVLRKETQFTAALCVLPVAEIK